MKISILILFFIISGCKTVSTISSKKMDFERYADTENISSFKILENIESYRPATCSDLSRNPFMTNRYEFKINE
ncbi:MAG: hypothetical protein EBW64_04955 [Betaproteobacteria bacterium]|nr:hypothetical protein [Betaproteobacteria bacterium]